MFYGLGLWLCLAGQAIAAPAGSEARAAFEAGAKAFGAGDYARALAEFERAMALKPSPKIHYNIGVCHQQLMLEARDRGEAEAEAIHAAAAVEAYKAYLRELPDAEDRLDVEATIRDLGGTPLTQFQLKSLPPPRAEAGPTASDEVSTPVADPPPPPKADAAVSEPPPTRPPSSTETPLPRGRVGATFGLNGQPQIGFARLDGAVQGFISLRAGAFVGARRRVYLGGAVLAAGAVETATDKLALQMQAVTLDIEYAQPLGRARRVELAFGGFVAGAREALRIRAEGQRPICAARPTGGLLSQRGGAGAGGRVGLHVLLGPRKNHEIGVRLSSAILGFGTGTAAAACEPPFAQFDVPRARWILFVDSGYAFRF
jgi:tetratricopeptide (TPR) repeat protein